MRFVCFYGVETYGDRRWSGCGFWIYQYLAIMTFNVFYKEKEFISEQFRFNFIEIKRYTSVEFSLNYRKRIFFEFLMIICAI